MGNTMLCIVVVLLCCTEHVLLYNNHTLQHIQFHSVVLKSGTGSLWFVNAIGGPKFLISSPAPWKIHLFCINDEYLWFELNFISSTHSLGDYQSL